MQPESTHDGDVHSLVKNNYFYGKLLTVRDMAAEQAYHTRARRLLSRFVTDYGSVCGLDVAATWEPYDSGEGGEVVVEVSSGLALDRCGRMVLVEEPVERRRELPLTDEDGPTDRLGVYVEYDECYEEPVPVAKTEHACEDECVENRIVETAEVTVAAGEPDVAAKSVAEIEFPGSVDLGVWPRGAAGGPVSVIEIEDGADGLDVPRGRVRFEGEVNAEEIDPAELQHLRVLVVRDADSVAVASREVDPDAELRWQADFDLSTADLEPGQDVNVYVRHMGTGHTDGAFGTVVEPGAFDGPQERGETGELTDRELSSVARSYYREEPREDCCPDLEEGRLLLGTVTVPDDAGWEGEAPFERGPLVYTNDLLYDVLARHVTDFENPHEVGLAVEDGTPGGGTAEQSSAEEGPSEEEGEMVHVEGDLIYAEEPPERVEDADVLVVEGDLTSEEDFAVIEEANPDVVFTVGGVDGAARELLLEARLLTVEGVDRADAQSMVDVLGASLVSQLSDLTQADLGTGDVTYHPEDEAFHVTGSAASGGGEEPEPADPSSAVLGVAEPDGPTGTVDLTSPDGSLQITGHPDQGEVAFTGAGGAYEQYLLVEKSLWNTLNSYIDMIVLLLRLRGMQGGEVPEALQDLLAHSVAVAVRTYLALSEEDHQDAQDYREYLVESVDLETLGIDPEEFEELPEEEREQFEETLGRFVGIDHSVVELERLIADAFGEAGTIQDPLLVRAVDYLEQAEVAAADAAGPDGVLTDARDLAVAQDRVAEAIPGILSALRAFLGGRASPASSMRFTSATIEGPTGSESATGGLNVSTVSNVVESLDFETPELSNVLSEATAAPTGLGATSFVRMGDRQVTGMPLEQATQSLERDDVQYRIEPQEVEDTQAIQGRQVGTVIDQYEATSGAGDREVVLSVLAAPSVERIDGIGDAYGDDLRAVGIGTVPELAISEPERVADVVGVGEPEAADWIDTAGLYDDAYDMTSVVGIGVDEAEAIAETSAAMWGEAEAVTSVGALASLELPSFVDDALRYADELTADQGRALRTLDVELVDEELEEHRN